MSDSPTTLDVGHWVNPSERIWELRQFKYGIRATVHDTKTGKNRYMKSNEWPTGVEVFGYKNEGWDKPVVMKFPDELPPVEELVAELADKPVQVTVEQAVAEAEAEQQTLAPWPPLITPATEIKRDRMSRPLVAPPDGGKPTPYTRVTTFVGALEDRFKLGQWSERMVALGMADRPDLQLAAIAHREDKDQLQQVADAAKESARASAAATTGTALHALIEAINRGQPLPINLPLPAVEDVATYRALTHHLKILAVEIFTVNDELKVGGTPDAIAEFGSQRYIADLKTGRIDFAAQKIAMQLALYSRSVAYNHESQERTELPGINQEWGIVLHLPAGEPSQAALHWIDLSKGWRDVLLAKDVRGSRSNKKGLLQQWPAEPLDQAIQNAPDQLALEGLYYSRKDEFTPEHIELARQRRQALTGDTQ